MAKKPNKDDCMIIHIPDPNFKRYCIKNFDVNNDGEISIEEALKIRHIDCCGLNIKSLEGIGNFHNLKKLHCDENKLTSLDLSNNLLLQ
ncbi:MAG: leucine-rich repeat domain-containing protein, partial [Candidatus Cloacimonetes bacterium]|nr:leucine-rich repeat domain-containing protein [Candidatus Cloacimonadota bacterium]